MPPIGHRGPRHPGGGGTGVTATGDYVLNSAAAALRTVDMGAATPYEALRLQRALLEDLFTAGPVINSITIT